MYLIWQSNRQLVTFWGGASFGYVAAEFALLLFSLDLQGSLCLVALVSVLALGVISSHSASETCRSENQQCTVLEITHNSCC